eukprot:11345730-Ditylum_brightwellii.AAC.1
MLHKSHRHAVLLGEGPLHPESFHFVLGARRKELGGLSHQASPHPAPQEDAEKLLAYPQDCSQSQSTIGPNWPVREC